MKPTPQETREALDEADKLKLAEGEYWPWVASRLGVKPCDVADCMTSVDPYFWFSDKDKDRQND